MNIASISNCRKCGDGYFTSINSTNYCSDFCKSNDYTLDLEERIELLEAKIEIMQKQLDKCLTIINDNTNNSHEEINVII